MSSDMHIVLDAFKENNAIRMGLNPVTTCSQLTSVEVNFERIDTICKEIHDLLNESSKHNSDPPNVIMQFNDLGKTLIESILPEKIRNDLRRYRDNETLFLQICLDEKLAYIPWELMCLDGECLACVFNIGRKIRTVYDKSNRTAEKKSLPFTMQIITNASDMLKKTGVESQKIRKKIDEDRSQTIRVLSSSRISVDAFFAKAQQTDMVHFAGHSEYHPNHPEKGGWKLLDGYFTIFHIIRLKKKKRVPFFIFSNSCQSGRFAHWQKFENTKQFSFGMAHEWMLAGVEHLIATLWEIRDTTGSQFAPYFYENLTKRLPIGEALRNARIRLKSERPDDLCWASYVLYGDPSYSYHAERRGDSINKAGRIWKLDFQRMHLIIGLMILTILTYNFFFKEFIKNIIDKQTQISITEQIKNYIALEKFLDEKEEALRKRILLHRKTMPRPNPFSSQLLTIVVEYVSPFSILNNNHEASIKSNIEKAIGEQTAYTCLEKERLDSIVFEASLENDFSGFLSARFHLFIAMDRDDKKINLVMRLVDKTRIGCDQWTVTIEEGFISKQQKLLIEQLVKTLNKTYKAKYPLKTTVKEVDDNGIIIDIGELHGVKLGQRFQTLNKKYVFDIFSLEKKQCILVSEQPKIILEKGDRLRTLE